jgi:RNA polymerase sigma-70 factor, ECF subfamily
MLEVVPCFGPAPHLGVLAVLTPNREAVARRGNLPVPLRAGVGGDDHVTRRAVARAREGDRAAAEYCYTRFAGDVQRYVQSIVHEPHDAEDVTQNVFVKLFGCMERYDERRAPFSAWLLRIARNAALDHLRHSRAVPSDELVRRRSAPARQDPDMSETLRDAFETLPDQQRLVLFLRHVLGLSPDEIAHELGRTPASVNGLQHRGRGALKAALRRAELTPAIAPSEHR